MNKSSQASGISDAELESLKKVLQALSLLPKPDEAQEAGTKGVIDDFSLAITKNTQNFVKLFSGGGALAGAGASALAWFRNQADVVLAASIASTAVIIAVGLYAAAKVMDGDVRGRASTATAAVEARGLLAQTMLAGYAGSEEESRTGTGGHATPERPTDTQILLALAAFKRRMTVATARGDSTVNGARWSDDEQLEVKLDNGDWVRAERVKSFSGEVVP